MTRNPYIDDDLAAIAEQARRFATERVAPGFLERDDTRVLDRGLMREIAGSPAWIESCPYKVHVWPFFAPILPEGREALARIADFIDRHAPSAVPPPL